MICGNFASVASCLIKLKSLICLIYVVGTARVVAIGAQVTSPLTHSSCEIEGFQTNEPPVDYAELQREAELLAKFLPPAPGVQCSVELQVRVPVVLFLLFLQEF